MTLTTALVLSIAGAAVAETPPAPPPAPVATADATMDAFGLPCEVTFTPKAAAKAKGKKKSAAKPVAPAGYATGVGGRGGAFGLERNERGPSRPSGDAEVRMQAATVTSSMVGTVVREHAGELELCLTRLPRDARAATVGLVLTIEPDGTASSVRVTGAPKATAFTACLASQARTWAYPHADAAVSIEYPITVNGR